MRLTANISWVDSPDGGRFSVTFGGDLAKPWMGDGWFSFMSEAFDHAKRNMILLLQDAGEQNIVPGISEKGRPS